MNAKRKRIYDKTDGKCYYCGCTLPKRWHQDHLVPVYRGRSDFSMQRSRIERGKDDVENLVPSCPRCNIRKNTLSVEGFRKEISKQVKRLLRDSNSFRLAVDYGLVEITNEDVEFYFETMKRDKQ